MRQKLQKFEQFVQTLLPHEVRYLLAIQQFQDLENLRLLEQILEQCQPGSHYRPFDTEIDKRKYSNLKKWILTRLEAVDVDQQFDWLHQLEQKINLDDIAPDEEQQLLNVLENFEPPYYWFNKLYELAQLYRRFLLIRLRYLDHERVMAFLEKWEPRYRFALEVEDRLYEATRDITSQYAFNDKDTRAWEPWLRQLFLDPDLDGHTRHQAVVRLTFLYINYREFEQLKDVYDELDAMYSRGENYSRRLLVNYYANRLILHQKLGNWDLAIAYGYLSLRHPTTERLQYLTNLAAVLLRQNRHKEVLNMMQEAIPLMRQSQNAHHKTGFVAFYLKALLDDGQTEQAERYADTFLRGNKQAVLGQQRWHIFFTLYLQVLIRQEKYNKVLSLVRKYKLMEREAEYRLRPVYLPSIHWYILVSQYKEGQINLDYLRQHLQTDMDYIRLNPHKRNLVMDLVKELYDHVPEAFAPFMDLPVMVQ